MHWVVLIKFNLSRLIDHSVCFYTPSHIHSFIHTTIQCILFYTVLQATQCLFFQYHTRSNTDGHTRGNMGFNVNVNVMSMSCPESWASNHQLSECQTTALPPELQLPHFKLLTEGKSKYVLWFPYTVVSSSVSGTVPAAISSLFPWASACL